MGSSKGRKHGSLLSIKQTIISAIYTNKKIFFISALLASIAYYSASSIISNQRTNPHISKRHNRGDNNAAELKVALKRKGDGRAAVAIIRVVQPTNETRYLVQLKSHDYPIDAFRGSVCLLGGNADKRDHTPIDTLKRELNEELISPDWVNTIINPTNIIDDSELQLSDKPLYNSTTHILQPGTIRYLGATLHFQSAEIINKPNSYAFTCALYEITITEDQVPSHIFRGANVQEGRVVLLTEDQLIQHSKFAWGYEYTIEKYFGRKTRNKQKGTAVSNIDKKTWEESVWTPEK